ncbi:unnamed protein product [Dicrocoelium dendriticum]|nr:unnamed protein product [Dicrocoelium dendriticum]
MSTWNLPYSGLVVNNLYGQTRWTNLRYLPPLHEMPHQWQPRLSRVDPFHWSGAEILKGGWIKWNSASHPDIIADSAAAVEPDWYTRRLKQIRQDDKKFCEQWAYDRWDKPTSCVTMGMDNPLNKLDYQRRPHRGLSRNTVKPASIPHGVKHIHFGIGSGYTYEEPIRAKTYPPLNDPKHV